MYVTTATRRIPMRRRGLGDAATDAAIAQKIGGIGTSIGAPAIGGALATTAGGVTTILGMAPALAIPIIGAALAGVTFAVTKLIANSGCGPTCIQASEYANQAEPLLRQNLNAYFALPKPRPQTAQAAALANFDNVWSQLVKLWSDPALGNAGKRGISDRQSGACTWKQTANYGADIMAAGEPAIGECWNWQSGYRAPIQNDPDTAPDSQAALPSFAGGLFSGSGGVSLPLLALVAVLVIAGVMSL